MFKHAMRTLWLGLLTFGLVACPVQIVPPGGTVAPAPTPEPPPPLNYNIGTGDAADRVRVVSDATYQPGGSSVLICLQLVGITWWKGIGVGQTEPTLQARDDNKSQCTEVAPDQYSLTFWKAKAFGVHTRMGSGSLDLRRYAGHKVTLRWSAD